MYLEIYSSLIYLFVFALGLALGSYLNSWVWRVHEQKYVFMGRSVCIHCGRELSWYENIPLFSFLFLRGKCKTCKNPIPISYFFVELGMALTFLLVAVLDVDAGAVRLFRDLFFAAVLAVIFVYDFKYQIILPGVIWLALIVGGFINIKYLGADPYDLAFGVVACAGFFLFQYLVSKGKWIGGGDVRLGAMMGVWLGLQGVLVAMFIAYIVGAVFGLSLIVLKKREASSAIPFGTFLALGTLSAVFWGEKIATWYLGLIS